MSPEQTRAWLSWMSELVKTMAGRHCTALIDQERTIGGDPIGHACSNAATQTHWIKGFGFRVCDRCAAIIAAEPDRVSFFAWQGRPGGDGA